ncbi:MAG TPA: small ribosomal subunit Rsm22 family protein [Terriglobales bacterium]|nr:small ribosomal subunit Rsm22 family protein [Terriglobales bacterium]
MQLPPQLAAAIQDEIAKSGIKPAELARAAEELSRGYRAERKHKPQLDAVHRAAYLITRLPATFAVISRILLELRSRIPDAQIASLLDLGSGPGTAMWAAAEIFPDLSRIELVEQSAAWIDMGKHLANSSGQPALRSAVWRQSSVVDESPSGIFDLVTISYVLNELRSADAVSVVRAAWQRTAQFLLVVEPGTPSGFAAIRTMRDELIAAGASVAAPCPHGRDCPIMGNDWCHFAQRIERSAEHRFAKSAKLGHEDEKFSYVLFSRARLAQADARILRHPAHHSGHVDLKLCTAEGLQQVTVSRREKERFREAKRAVWGDAFLCTKPGPCQ